MAFEVSDKFADYEIVGILGSGGMGRVYKVRNVLTNRFEAMKVLLPDAAGTADRGERFLREIRVHASLEHPNIAAVRTALRVEDQVVLIMELVEGTTLQTLINQTGGLPLAKAIDYISQALSALSFAHQNGVIHRDIKPSNIMITPAGDVKLMDFGIARTTAEHSLTSTGSTLGSLYYMSPEQVKGGALDGRSDLYSLGLTLYQAVTGVLPFTANQDFAIMSAHLTQAPTPPRDKNPSIPPELNRAILKSLAKNPAERFQTAAEFRQALQQIVPLLVPATSSKTVVVPETTRPTDSRSNSTAGLEMAYVLFMDIVAYSSLPMDRQTERISTLVDIVRNTEEFRTAHASDQLISLPTGDGMALVFFRNPVAPVQCASEIARKLAMYPEIKLRMGIHNGPVYRIPDINTNLNVAGGGINMAQRVMDCGDAGHILVSRTVADTLGQLSDWAGCFHDLGPAEVKHGVIVQLANFYKDDVGNPALPQKVQKTAPTKTVPDASIIDARVHARPAGRGIYAGVGIALVVLLVFGAVLFTRGKDHGADKNSTAPLNGGSPPIVPPVKPPDAAPPGPPSSTAGPAPSSVPGPDASVRPVRTADPSTKVSKRDETSVSPRPMPEQPSVVPPSAPPVVVPASPPASAPPAQPAGLSAEEKAALQEQRERMITLGSRAAAVRNSLQNLERQQSRSGLSLRADMVSARESMNYLFEEAKNSLAANDVATTKRNLDLAEQQLTKLERFLGQ